MGRVINSSPYINRLCEAVLDSLRNVPYTAVPDSFTVDYAPTHESVERDYAVVVNVGAVENERITRSAGGQWFKTVEVRIIIRKNIGVSGQSAAVASMLTEVGAVVDHLKSDLNTLKIDGYPFSLLSVSQDPVYDYTSLMEDSLFISVVTATYKGII